MKLSQYIRNGTFLFTITRQQIWSLWFRNNNVLFYCSSSLKNLIFQKRINRMCTKHWCGSVKVWYWSGSGSADPYHPLTDPGSGSDPGPAFFVRGRQDGKKIFVFSNFFVYYFLKIQSIIGNSWSIIYMYNESKNGIPEAASTGLTGESAMKMGRQTRR